MKKTASGQARIAKKVSSIINKWNSRKWIAESELYALFIQIKQQAQKYRLIHIEYVATEKLNYLEESSSKEWMTDKWKYFLSDLIRLVKNNDIRMANTNEFLQKVESQKSVNNVVLLIDNDEEFLRSAKDELEQHGYHVVIAVDREKGLELLYTMCPAFVAIDLNLSVDKDRRYLAKFTETSQSYFTPIAIISSCGNFKRNQLIAFSFGVTAYLAKPLDFDVFVSYINNRVQLQRRIRSSTTIDELTKTYKRNQIDGILKGAILGYERYRTPFSVVMFDLDYFKKVNDQYGHVAGDIVLREFAQVTKEQIRDMDYLFRYGGEEFLLYIPNATADLAFEIVDRIRSVFNKKLFTFNNHSFQVTFSAGVTTINNANIKMEFLIDQADKALYRSKENGRNCTTIYSDHVIQSPVKTLRLIIIDDDRFIRTVLEDMFTHCTLDRDITIEVHTYVSGKEFLADDWYVPTHKYFLFLDGVMPQMDGMEVLKRVRKQYPAYNVFISMLSARNKEENIVEALEAGADDYMFKPFQIPELKARVERIISRIIV